MCWSACCCCAPKKVSRLLIRISFGLSLFFLGIAHYRDISLLVNLAQKDLGFLTPLGAAWGYIYPALLIVGGILFVVGMLPQVAVWTAGIALASVPAGMLLKSALTGGALAESMPAAESAFIWITVFMLISKGSNWMCCSKACNESKGEKGGCCGCGGMCCGTMPKKK